MTVLRRLLFILALFLCALAHATGARLPAPEPGKLTVYFLDVGQGDAALIVSPTGKTVLIDGGPPEAGRSLAARLASVTRAPLDLMVLSHAHLDHLGGLPDVLVRVGARRYLEPGFDHPTTAYRRLLEVLAERRVPYLEVAPAEDGTPFSIGIGDGTKLTVLWPRRPLEPFISGSRSDANANSLVLRLDYGETSFLFTGDAEADTESRLLRSGLPLGATVLKVAHHGSRHSSQTPFIARVAPKAAVVSCGADNDYGHPHGRTLERLREVGAEVIRIDRTGTVRAVSDGRVVSLDAVLADGRQVRHLTLVRGADQSAPAAQASVVPAAGAEPRARPAGVSPPASTPTATVMPADGPEDVHAPFVASRRSKVFHRSDCPTVARISPKNRVEFADRASAAQARRPSGDCDP